MAKFNCVLRYTVEDRMDPSCGVVSCRKVEFDVPSIEGGSLPEPQALLEAADVMLQEMFQYGPRVVSASVIYMEEELVVVR